MNESLRTAFGWMIDTDHVRTGESRNGVIHVVSLTSTKTAGALIDPKMVLSWLLTVPGAPGTMIGMLVPVREAGALLPQFALHAAGRSRSIMLDAGRIPQV